MLGPALFWTKNWNPGSDIQTTRASSQSHRECNVDSEWSPHLTQTSSTGKCRAFNNNLFLLFSTLDTQYLSSQSPSSIEKNLFLPPLLLPSVINLLPSPKLLLPSLFFSLFFVSLSLISQTKPFDYYFSIYYYQTQTHKRLSPILASFLSQYCDCVLYANEYAPPFPTLLWWQGQVRRSKIGLFIYLFLWLFVIS